jgi:hypothetical protein
MDPPDVLADKSKIVFTAAVVLLTVVLVVHDLTR